MWDMWDVWDTVAWDAARPAAAGVAAGTSRPPAAAAGTSGEAARDRPSVRQGARNGVARPRACSCAPHVLRRGPGEGAGWMMADGDRRCAQGRGMQIESLLFSVSHVYVSTTYVCSREDSYPILSK